MGRITPRPHQARITTTQLESDVLFSEVRVQERASHTHTKELSDKMTGTTTTRRRRRDRVRVRLGAVRKTQRHHPHRMFGEQNTPPSVNCRFIQLFDNSFESSRRLKWNDSSFKVQMAVVVEICMSKPRCSLQGHHSCLVCLGQLCDSQAVTDNGLICFNGWSSGSDVWLW